MDATDLTSIPWFPSEAVQEHARGFAGTAIALHCVAFIVLAARLWTRSYPILRMKLDDLACIIAYILILTNSILLLRTIPYTFGQNPNAFFQFDAQTSFRYIAIAQPIWAWSMASVKISFALTLLRIEQAPKWRHILWILLAVELIFGVYNTLTIMLQCAPFHKAWDLTNSIPGSCSGEKARSVNAIGVSVIDILTNLIFTLLPIRLVQEIQRPVRDRVIMVILICFGFFICVASVARTVAVAQYGHTGAPINEGIITSKWSVVEELVGFIIICIPTLRTPCQQIYEIIKYLIPQTKLSIRKHIHHTNQSPSNHPTHSLTTLTSTSHSTPIFKLRSLRTEPSDSDLTTDSEASKDGIWCTKEVMVEHDRLSRWAVIEMPDGIGEEGEGRLMSYGDVVRDLERGRVREG